VKGEPIKGTVNWKITSKVAQVCP